MKMYKESYDNIDFMLFDIIHISLYKVTSKIYFLPYLDNFLTKLFDSLCFLDVSQANSPEYVIKTYLLVRK